MLKGKATIELTNIKTGEVEIYEDKNLVTNAINDILSINPGGRHFWQNVYGIHSQGLLPIFPNLIGGILLYNKPLEENPDKYYAPSDNILIGYSTNSVNTNADPQRGSMNVTESKKLENGYKFVFDFQTSQGNGLISSIGLTSRWGGAGGYGNLYEASSTLSCGSISVTYNSVAEMIPFVHSCAYDENTDTFISVQLLNENTISIKRIAAKCRLYGLFNTPWFNQNRDIISELQITTESFGNYLSGVSTPYKYHCFIEDKLNNKIWGFYTPGNSSGDATITWIKIDKNDFTFEEGTWTMPNINLSTFGYSYYYDNDRRSGKTTHAIIKDNYLYCCNYDSSGIYKINLNNIEDILLISGDVTKVSSDSNTGDRYYNCTNSTFNLLGNIIYFKNGYIMNDTIYPCTAKTVGLHNTINQDMSYYGPYLYVPSTYYTTAQYYSDTDTRGMNYNVYLKTPYLATINNLETPIEKTEDKTMKITYILTEVEDEE